MLRILFVLTILGIALSAPAFAAKPDSVTELRTKAEAGDSRAAFELAVHFDYGKGVAQDRKEAAAWYLVAANGGIAEAQNSLGSLYQAGDGVTQDFSQALGWFQKAAEQNHPEATNNIGYLYDEGKGVPEDNARAIELYTKAAELGYINSMVNLSIMYRTGDGVPADASEAYKWLDLARFYTQLSKDRQLKWQVRGRLDRLKTTMTPDEIAEGEKRASQWTWNHK